MELQLPELLANKTLSAIEICDQLQLNTLRGWKFLHALSLAGLLIEKDGEMGQPTAQYALHPDVRIMLADGSYFFKDYILFQKYVNNLIAKVNFVDILKGAKLPVVVKWPPPTISEAAHIERWMAVTSKGALYSLIHSNALQGVKRLLDVGGGDGTMAIALNKHYADTNPLHITVYNLPASALLARHNMETNAPQRILDKSLEVVEGNFIEDQDLPNNYDAIMFSRVLTDWSPENCRLILEKVKYALITSTIPNLEGKRKLIINEAFNEGNINCAMSWEYRYIISDTFGKACFKSVDTYCKMLSALGFTVTKVTPMTDDNFYSVLEAEI